MCALLTLARTALTWPYLKAGLPALSGENQAQREEVGCSNISRWLSQEVGPTPYPFTHHPHPLALLWA